MIKDPLVPIELGMVLKVQVYYPPAQQEIKLRFVGKVPVTANLLSANDNGDDNGQEDCC